MSERKSDARAKTVQTIVVCVVFAAFLGLAVASTLSATLRRYRPDIALDFRPSDAVAKARLASLIQERSGFSAARGVEVQLAKEALVRDPTVAVAARVLGMGRAAGGERDAAAEAMTYADALTRRDLPTQVWLIEYHLERGEIPQMLRNFEAAASTSRGAMSVLFPIMVTALNEPEMVGPVADLLSREPWWAASLVRGIAEGNGSTRNAGRLFIELAERGHAPRPDLAVLVVRRLESEGFAADARRLDQLAVKSPARAPVN